MGPTLGNKDWGFDGLATPEEIEAASRGKIKARSLRYYAGIGQIPRVRVGKRKYFRVADVLKFLGLTEAA